MSGIESTNWLITAFSERARCEYFRGVDLPNPVFLLATLQVWIWSTVISSDTPGRTSSPFHISIYSETQQLLKPINLQYRGSVNSDGRQEYYAFVENACSTFFTDKRPPRLFKTYFTESRDSKTNWISPKYYWKKDQGYKRRRGDEMPLVA